MIAGPTINRGRSKKDSITVIWFHEGISYVATTEKPRIDESLLFLPRLADNGLASSYGSTEMGVWQKIFCLQCGQVRRHSAADPLQLHCPRKRKFLSHFSQKAEKHQGGSRTVLMVEHYTSEAIHRLCGNTHTSGATSNVPSTARRSFKLGHSKSEPAVPTKNSICLVKR
jgi:hypothetical protein